MLTFYFREWDASLVVHANGSTTWDDDEKRRLKRLLDDHPSSHHSLDRLVFASSLDVSMVCHSLEVVRPYSRIQTLDLRNVVLKYGSVQALSSMAKCLEELPLKSIYLNRIQCQKPPTKKKDKQHQQQQQAALPEIGILFRALAGMSQLKNADIGLLVQHAPSAVVWKFLEESNSLIFFKATFQDCQVVAFADYLCQKRHSRAAPGKTIISIQKLEMAFDTPLSDRAADAVASILQTPSSIDKLALWFSSIKLSERTLIRIFRQGLDASCLPPSSSGCIRNLYLFTRCHPSKRCIRVLEQQFEHHYRLHKLLWGYNDDFLETLPVNVQICFRLNQAGREHVMRQAGGVNAQEWFVVLDRVKDDLDSLFFLLSRNPALVVDASKLYS